MCPHAKVADQCWILPREAKQTWQLLFSAACQHSFGNSYDVFLSGDHLLSDSHFSSSYHSVKYTFTVSKISWRCTPILHKSFVWPYCTYEANDQQSQIKNSNSSTRFQSGEWNLHLHMYKHRTNQSQKSYQAKIWWLCSLYCKNHLSVSDTSSTPMC